MILLICKHCKSGNVEPVQTYNGKVLLECHNCKQLTEVNGKHLMSLTDFVEGK